MIDKRMMYAQGQRVAKSLEGLRPGYRGSDYGDQAAGRGAYSGSSASTGGDNSPAAGGNQGGTDNDRFSSSNTGSGSTVDRSSNLQTYNHNIATGQEDKNPIGPVLFNEREQMQQAFRNFRPEMPKIPLGLGSLVMQMINPGGKGALQAFSNFSAGKNRNYFMDEVVRAGKIPGLNYGTVADMTPEKLDKFYKDYLADRSSGSIDAYGNPIGGQDDSGITSIYDARPYQMTQNVEVEDPVQNLFASRFLQNQPDEVRETIEANMPIRFPNLFT